MSEPRSLLRRLLKRADEAGTAPYKPAPDGDQLRDNAAKPTPTSRGEASPVRPVPPTTESESPPPPIAPRPRVTQEVEIPKQIGGVEDRLQAEAALEKLRQKTAQVAAEFADGKLNRAQFAAIYARYNELRQIIERMLANNPTTQAWQRVAQPGPTTFLREHFEAQALSYAIYDYASETPISAQGSPPLPDAVTKQVLSALNVITRSKGNPGPLGKQIGHSQWLVIVPGKRTISLVMFSLEPSTHQIRLVQDLHGDFERANHVLLERGIRTPEQLVFPHRALFNRSVK